MKKGFTLIELLVVIAILAVLATAVVLVLNPVELLKQGRDSTRISDLAAVNSAMSLWVSDVIAATGWPTTYAATSMRCTSNVSTTKPSAFAIGSSPCTFAPNTTTSGTGWIPLDLTLIAGGSPLPRLPIDPNNGSLNCTAPGIPLICEYAMNVSSTVGIYKIAAKMESVKFNTGGGAQVTNTDGGTDANWYEIGSNMAM